LEHEGQHEPDYGKARDEATMRNPQLEGALCDAIKKHLAVRLSYKRQNYSRTFEPYIVYRSTRDNILVAGWQTKDDSEPSKAPEWHNFEVELISALKITDKTFEYDVRFNPALDIYRKGVVCVIERLKVT
jgi:hypothetical protein